MVIIEDAILKSKIFQNRCIPDQREYKLKNLYQNMKLLMFAIIISNCHNLILMDNYNLSNQ